MKSEKISPMFILTVYSYLFLQCFLNSQKITAGSHPQSPCRFAWQPSVSISHKSQSSYLSQVIAAATKSDQYWHLHRSDCRNRLIYAHKISRNLTPCDIILGLLTLHAQEAPRLCGINHAIHVLLVSFDEGKNVRRRRKNIKILLGGYVHVLRGEKMLVPVITWQYGPSSGHVSIFMVRTGIRVRCYIHDMDQEWGAVCTA